MRRDPNTKVLRPVHPNAGIRAMYRKRIERLVDEMARSYVYWLKACYRENQPRIAMANDENRRGWAVIQFPLQLDPDSGSVRHVWLAMDATPAWELQQTLKRLGKRWQANIDASAPKLADYFSTAMRKRSDAALRRILKDAGYSVKFRVTPTMRDVLDATVGENVSLIKSIPAQFHTQIEGMVMRSVTAGRDLASLTRDLQHAFGVTRRRAALIARSQNNLATAAFTRVRQEEVGIEWAVWLHSHGGKEPRPTHLANSGKRYRVSEGWYDPDPKVRRNIWPGQLINCRCVSRAVVKGFS